MGRLRDDSSSIALCYSLLSFFPHPKKKKEQLLASSITPTDKVNLKHGNCQPLTKCNKSKQEPTICVWGSQETIQPNKIFYKQKQTRKKKNSGEIMLRKCIFKWGRVLIFFISNISRLHLYKLIFIICYYTEFGKQFKKKAQFFLTLLFLTSPPISLGGIQFCLQNNQLCRYYTRKTKNTLLLISVIHHKKKISLEKKTTKKMT